MQTPSTRFPPKPVGRMAVRNGVRTAVAFAVLAIAALIYWFFTQPQFHFGVALVFILGAAIAGFAIGIYVFSSHLIQEDFQIQTGEPTLFPAINEAMVAKDIPTLLEAIKDSDKRVRVAAMNAIGRIGPPESDAAVPELLKIITRADDPRISIEEANRTSTCRQCGAALTKWNTEMSGVKSGKCGKCLRIERGSTLAPDEIIALQIIAHVAPATRAVAEGVKLASNDEDPAIAAEAQKTIDALKARHKKPTPA